MSEHNKTLVRRFYEEVENEGQLELVDELFDPDFRDVHNSVAPFPVVGIEGVKKLATALRERLELRTTIADLIAEGDLVVARISTRSCHNVEFMGVPPTGREFRSEGVEIFRVVNGKLAERWVFIDQLPTMRELGIVPRPAHHG